MRESKSKTRAKMKLLKEFKNDLLTKENIKLDFRSHKYSSMCSRNKWMSEGYVLRKIVVALSEWCEDYKINNLYDYRENKEKVIDTWETLTYLQSTDLHSFIDQVLTELSDLHEKNGKHPSENYYSTKFNATSFGRSLYIEKVGKNCYRFVLEKLQEGMKKTYRISFKSLEKARDFLKEYRMNDDEDVLGLKLSIKALDEIDRKLIHLECDKTVDIYSSD